MQEKIYQVVRFYQNDRSSRVQRKNLSLKEARAWCNDPETSSSTKEALQSPKTQARYTLNRLHWFDGYTEQVK